MRKVRIDTQYSAKPINRYLLKLTATKFTYEQEVESVKDSYVVQWKNIFHDLKRFAINPFQTYPKVAVSLSSILLFLLGREEEARFLFIGSLTLDSATESEYSTTTFNVTVASNDNRMLAFGYGHYQGDSGLSGVTYNGSALTLIHDQEGSFEERASLWALVAPATGTNSFVISGAGNWSGYGVASVYDADQNLPTNHDGSSGSSSSPSDSLTTTVDGAWVMACIGCEPTPTMSTSGGVEIMKQQGASYQNAEMHYVAKATAGAQTMSWSLSYGARWNIAMMEIKPAPVASSDIKKLSSVAQASLKKVSGVAIASVASVAGVSN